MAVRTVDAHHHLWLMDRQEHAWRTHDHEVIARDFTPADLAEALAAAGVDATVLVQSVDTPEENDRLAGYTAEVAAVAGVVSWLPLADAEAARAELDRVELPARRGVRCLVAREPMEWLARPPVRGLLRELADRGLAWDVVPVTEEQVDAVLAAARAVPNLRIVVDHLARPPLDGGPGELKTWQDRIRALAGCPGVALKVSVGIDVLTRWSQWRAHELHDVVAHALSCFGPQRLMLASNWPVVLLRRSYAGAWADLTAAVETTGLGADELAQVTGGTASRWYRLDDPR